MLSSFPLCAAYAYPLYAPVPVGRPQDSEKTLLHPDTKSLDISAFLLSREGQAATQKGASEPLSVAGILTLGEGIYAYEKTLKNAFFSEKLRSGKKGKNERWKAFGTLHLSATLTANGSPIERGLFWRILSAVRDESDDREEVAFSEEAQPVFKLIAADYVVQVSYGLANTERKVSVLGGGRRTEREIVLDAGGLRVTSRRSNGQIIPDSQVNHSVYLLQDSAAEGRLIFPAALSGKVIRLNAGNYRVTSHYGDANALVKADIAVQAGHLSEAVIRHSASKVTFKLVYRQGGEALANTSWKILSADEKIVAESVGAFPRHILSAGDYVVVARYGGDYYRKEFTLRGGEDREIELIAVPD